jgi:biotin carboxyl carrier protein
MFELTLKGKNYKIEKQGNHLLINGQSFAPDVVRIDDHRLHLLLNGRGYVVELLKHDGSELSLQVNKKHFELDIRSELDIMLNKLGVQAKESSKINDIKAPMPGLVLRTIVTQGQGVAKGDPLLVLESMKMENVIKSPGAGVVDALLVQTGAAVEKGEVLVRLK